MPSSVDQWTIVVGILLPLVIAMINRTAWSASQKAIGALVICIGAAAVEVAIKGQWTPKNFAANAVAVFFIVVTTYKGFWQPTGIANVIETKTG